MTPEKRNHNLSVQKPLELPIFHDSDDSPRQRFVSRRAMYQLRGNLLKRLLTRMNKEVSSTC